jgi:3-oxoacyl-[acyl-carrier protein] reductase
VLDLAASIERHPPPKGVAALSVDATDRASLGRAFDRIDGEWRGLDGLVNLCGFTCENQPAAAISEDSWNEVLAGNLLSVQLACALALPLLVKGKGAAIVNAASGLAHNVRPGFGAYSAAKAGVIALTKTLALENAPAIRVNAVAPSAVDTAFLRGGTGRSNERGEEFLDIDAYVKAIPLGRIARPDDISGPILFLLSEEARYMTGQVLWINGGSYLP